MSLISFPYKFIAIEGNIGTGKTTLCNMVNIEYNCKLILEEFGDNPFLSYFYNDPKKYAFTVELFFMTERYKQMQSSLSDGNMFIDYTISDYTFVKTLLFARQNLSHEEYLLFQNMYGVLEQSIVKPDIIVYLHRNVEILKTNIENRGRTYEQKISLNYLKSIQDSYFEYFRNIITFPVVILDLKTMDFQENEMYYNEIKKILSKKYRPGVHRINLMV